MWVLHHKEGWVPKNWGFWTVVLEKTLESLLDSKQIKPVNPKGNQPWKFIGRAVAEAEAPILWPPDVKSQLFRKDPDAGKDWRQEEKGTTEDEMVGWHHWLNGHEFKHTPRDSEGQGSLFCCRTKQYVVHHWFRSKVLKYTWCTWCRSEFSANLFNKICRYSDSVSCHRFRLHELKWASLLLMFSPGASYIFQRLKIIGLFWSSDSMSLARPLVPPARVLLWGFFLDLLNILRHFG